MRRGAILTASALYQLTQDSGHVNVRTLVDVARWQAAFVHHHHQSEDELFWPVLRALFPESVAALDGLTAEHDLLDTELQRLSKAIDAISANQSAAVDLAREEALPTAERVRDVLIAHLDTEEPILKDLFPQVPGAEVVRLRKAIVAGSPRSGPDLVIGLLEDPTPAVGYDAMITNFPAPIRWLRPVLRRRYDARKRSLGTQESVRDGGDRA
jgi:hemerythrin-like domain-containing protein